MRGTIVLLAAFIVCALRVQAQEITLSVENERLERIFREIRKQTGYHFIYDDAVIRNAKPVTLNVSKSPISDVLQLCFKDQPVTFLIEGKTIIVKPRPAKVGAIDNSEKKRVTGIMRDDKGDVLPGVNVILKGTSIGTSTDANGEYSIETDDDDILVFSFIGFKTIETPLSGRIKIDVEMEEDIQSLGAVTINAGYYDVLDREKTGSISRIDSKIIEKQPVANPLQALQGRVPGVIITQETGFAGSGFSVQIRGRNSIQNTNGQPLYVVDGVPYASESLFATMGGVLGNNAANALNSINPSDIESIEILKDADATSIYGSRGANGVVLITTKKGKSGKTSVDISLSYGASQMAHFVDLLSTPQYLEMKKEALKNSNRWPVAPAIYRSIPDVFVWDTTRYTNWQEEFLGGTANVSNVQVSLSGGTSKTQYLFSGSYYKEGSVFPGDFAYQRGSGLLNLNHTSENEKFNFSLSTNYTTDINELPTLDLTNVATTLAPTAPALFDENGDLNWEDNTFNNPMATYLKKTYQATGDNFIANAGFRYELVSGLFLKTNLGYNKRQSGQLSTSPAAAVRPDLRSSFIRSSGFGTGTVKTWIMEPQAEFTRQIRKGTISVLVGTSFQETKKSGEVKSASGFSSDALLKNVDAASDLNISFSDAYQYRYAAVFGRINYNFKDRYILNLTARRDGSSRFGPDRQFGNFGAAGAAWIFSSEDFIKNRLNYLSFGKLRTSYGSTGSDNINNYQYLDSYTPTEYAYRGTTGLIPSRLANDDYGWESNRKLEAAVEMGFIEDRILFSASYYNNRSSNQLVGYALPVITGQPFIQKNLPATVENTGWEFELSTVNLKGVVSWTSAFNMSVPRNKLIKYPDLENSTNANGLVIGKSLNIVVGYRYLGVHPLTGEYSFEDMNADGMLNQDDYQVIGKLGADGFLGLSNSITFKGLQLDFFVQAVKQTQPGYIRSFTSYPGSSDVNNSQPVVVLNRWQFPGDITEIERFRRGTAATESYGNLIQSDRSLADASYLRLKSFQLAYTLPDEWINKVKIQSARVFVQGQNLFTITNYIGLDPESHSSMRLPPLRTITTGIQISI